MVDHLSKEKRSWNMSRIKSKDTEPEIKLRSALHALGFRFRIHKRDLPGKPDIVLPKYNTVIFINGCFWHGHNHCSRANVPKTHTKYWTEKIHTNRKRDEKNFKLLKKMGWKIIVVWECEMDNLEKIVCKVSNKLGKK